MANSFALSTESARACQNNFPPVAAKLLVIRHFYSASGLKSSKADAFSVATGKIWNLVKLDTDEAREIVKDEAAHCPAGRLVIWDKTTGKVIEPKFAAQLGLIEDTEKKVGGPIWVRGGIPARNADGFATMGDFLVQPRLVAAAEDEFGNKIRRAAGRLSQWHAETEKIFGVHD